MKSKQNNNKKEPPATIVFLFSGLDLHAKRGLKSVLSEFRDSVSCRSPR